MTNEYYIEKLVPAPGLDWEELGADTFTWEQATPLTFATVTLARIYINTNFDKRLSYRITDGGRIFQA